MTRGPGRPMDHAPGTKQKAFQLNLDPKIYGSFAEIGAGQEVARHFFRTGGASGTVAKTMSAYDMKFSDDIYGKERAGGRYVSESRILKMLDHEFGLLERRLKERRRHTRFFAFANTVAAKSHTHRTQHHGWAGVRFQHEPTAPPSETVIHVRMLDNENVQQQEALGVIGVNLIHACFHHVHDRERFVRSLLDNLSTDRIEIDMIRVQGDGFEGKDPRLFCLELVKRDFCRAVMFNAKGKALQAGDALYKKKVVLCRGSYRPPTLRSLDMLKKGTDNFLREAGGAPKDVLVLPEISMSKLAERNGRLDNQDFLARVELLNALGHNVLVSNYRRYWELSRFVAGAKTTIAYVMRATDLEEFFQEARDHEDEMGLLGALDTLAGKRTKLYVYPSGNGPGDPLLTFGTVRVGPDARLLIEYLERSGKIRDIEPIDTDVFCVWSRDVLNLIRDGIPGWEESVPDVVAKIVKKKRLFGIGSSGSDSGSDSEQ